MDRPPYPVAVRLYAIAETRWPEIDAAYLSVDLIRLPVHRFLNAVYTWCVDRLAAPDKREEWDMQLAAPLPWQKPTRPIQVVDDAEAETFAAFIGTPMTGRGGI